MTQHTGNTAAKLNDAELADLRSLIANTATAPTTEDLYAYQITLSYEGKPLPGSVKHPMTDKRAKAIKANGFWQVGEKMYTVESIVKVGNDPI